jgi:DNA polymerase-3 subunit epsilon
MVSKIDEPEDLARRLEATGNYKILRRLSPQQPIATPAGCGGKVGIIVDLETTGLDANKDEIIEVAMVKFGYSNSDQVTGVTGIFQAFNQPAAPIPAEIVALTGITDAMVTGHQIDAAALESFVAGANIVIAHNASFDRKFAEVSWSFFEHKNWACSATGVEWQKYGFGGVKLPYLLTQAIVERSMSIVEEHGMSTLKRTRLTPSSNFSGEKSTSGKSISIAAKSPRSIDFLFAPNTF